MPPPRDAVTAQAPANVPLDRVQARAMIGCLLDRARSPREVMKLLSEEATPTAVQIAAEVAVARAAADGASPEARVLTDVIDAATELDDVAMLKAALAQLDASAGKATLMSLHHGPMRARAGLPIAASEIAGDYLAIAREQAIAGDVVGATAFLDANTKQIEWGRELDAQVGAFVAVGRLADARRVIAAAKAEDRLKLAGVWLDTALRLRTPLTEALAAVLAELEVASDRALLWFGERAVFRRAQRLGRGKELAPLAQALEKRFVTVVDRRFVGTEMRYDLAVAVGEPAAIQALAADPSLASYLAIRTAPLAQALAVATAEKYPQDDLVRVWARALPAAPPGFGDTLMAAACPKAPVVRGTPTPPRAGAKLAVIEKARKKRQECALHDVVVRLTAGDEVLGEETLEGECHGACTAAEKREGEASYQEILKAIDRGEASESQTDYNFTDCMFVGPEPGRIDQVDGRDVALIVQHAIGPHDVPKIAYALALEVCGALHVSEVFWERYMGSWALGELTLRMSPDKTQLVVDGASDRWHGVVYRLTLPPCPGTPVGQALETE